MHRSASSEANVPASSRASRNTIARDPKIHRRNASNEKDPLPQKRRSERSTVEGQGCRTILATSREARPGGMAPTSSPCDPPDCCPAGCPSSSVCADSFGNRGRCSHRVEVEIRRTQENTKVCFRIHRSRTKILQGRTLELESVKNTRHDNDDETILIPVTSSRCTRHTWTGTIRVDKRGGEKRNRAEGSSNEQERKKVVDQDDVGYCEDRERDTHQVQGW